MLNGTVLFGKYLKNCLKNGTQEKVRYFLAPKKEVYVVFNTPLAKVRRQYFKGFPPINEENNFSKGKPNTSTLTLTVWMISLCTINFILVMYLML